MKLGKLMEHFRYLYGRRNRLFLPSLRDRIDFLNLGIGDLQDAIRKEMPIGILEIALARVVARIACIVEHFEQLPLEVSMMQKYPKSYCSYCMQFPCYCSERRREVALSCPDLNQFSWELKEWCEHLNALYGERNRARGVENVLNRLFKEVSELLSLSMRGNVAPPDVPLYKIEGEFALEVADAIAWTIAVANICGIDLERAVLARYELCWKCKRDRCECTSFSMEPVRWETMI